MRKSKLAKRLCVICISILTLAMVGCGEKNGEDTSKTKVTFHYSNDYIGPVQYDTQKLEFLFASVPYETVIGDAKIVRPGFVADIEASDFYDARGNKYGINPHGLNYCDEKDYSEWMALTDPYGDEYLIDYESFLRIFKKCERELDMWGDYGYSDGLWKIIEKSRTNKDIIFECMRANEQKIFVYDIDPEKESGDSFGNSGMFISNLMDYYQAFEADEQSNLIYNDVYIFPIMGADFTEEIEFIPTEVADENGVVFMDSEEEEYVVIIEDGVIVRNDFEEFGYSRSAERNNY